MPLITYTVICTGKKLIALGVYELRFTKPTGFTFQPGQFVLFHVALIENPADIQTRALSIASVPSEDDLLFIAKMVPEGRISRWIEEVVTEGSPAPFQGPFGNFLLDRVTDKEYLFIATGTGIAPFRSMIGSTLSQGDARRMDVVFGVKSEQDLFWQQELIDLPREYPSVSLHVVLSSGSPQWTGHRGRVQEVAPAVAHENFSGKSLYVCGSPAMCQDVKRLALTEWWMQRKDVHVEGYI